MSTLIKRSNIANMLNAYPSLVAIVESVPLELGCGVKFVEAIEPFVAPHIPPTLLDEIKSEAYTWRQPFGKHRGMKIEDLPISYLEWLTTRTHDERYAEYFAKVKEIYNARSAPQ